MDAVSGRRKQHRPVETCQKMQYEGPDGGTVSEPCETSGGPFVDAGWIRWMCSGGADPGPYCVAVSATLLCCPSEY